MWGMWATSGGLQVGGLHLPHRTQGFNTPNLRYIAAQCMASDQMSKTI